MASRAPSKAYKEKILRALEEDREFRYAVAGLIGIREVLERLDGIEKNQERIWQEIKGLREEQARTWREIEKLWEEVRELRRGQERLWTEVRGLRTSFEQLGRSVGMTLDHYAAAFIKELLIERGYPETVKVEAEVKLKDPKSKRTWEIDVFCENPLVVGEVTTTVGTAEEAEAEVSKLLERVSFVKELYGEEVQLKLLVVANASAEAKERLRALAQRHDLTVLVGRELSEL